MGWCWYCIRVAGTSTRAPWWMHAEERRHPDKRAEAMIMLLFFIVVKNKKNGNVVSRVLFRPCSTLGRPLSSIYCRRRRRPLSTYPPARASQPRVAGIFGLSTHKVCHRAASLSPVVSSCLALAPLPVARRFIFLWHSLSAGPLPPRRLPVRKYGGSCCPDFPPAAQPLGAPRRR